MSHVRSGRWLRLPRRQRAVSLLWLAAGALVTGGCREQPAPPRPVKVAPQRASGVEEGEAVRLAPGQAFHFVDHFRGGSPPADSKLAVPTANGHQQIEMNGLVRPAIPAPAPYVMRQRVRMPGPGKLRLAFGLAPGSYDKPGLGTRFVVRLRRGDQVTELLSAAPGRWRGPDAANWRPTTIDVPASPGEHLELELAAEPAVASPPGAPADRASAYSLWVDPTLIIPGGPPRPNIVLVVIDALRPDHLGCYGYSRGTSPFLDRLAREGVVFEQAHAQGTWTLPSTYSFLTSSYRLLIGSETAEAPASASTRSFEAIEPVDMAVSLQALLRDSGYATLAATGGGYLDPWVGFTEGFDWYQGPARTPALADELKAIRSGLPSYAGQPFFLWLHTYEVHNYFQRGRAGPRHFGGGYHGPLTNPKRLEEAVLGGTSKGLRKADIQYAIDLYDSQLVHTDHSLERFFRWLFAQPWGRNTAIAVIADHGEAFGEHNRMHHGDIPFREVVQVPLILRLPDGRWRGKRVSQPVSLVDLAPTLLDIAGARSSPELVGRSLLPLLEGAEVEPEPVFCECRGGALLAREGRWWYLTWIGSDTERLFDMERDPRQLHDLSQVRPEELYHMRRVLARLAMRAARTCRVAIAGPRNDALTVSLEAAAPFSYFYVPTMRASWPEHVRRTSAVRTAAGGPRRAGGRDRIEVTIPAGDDEQVILFATSDPHADIVVSAQIGGRPVGPERFHLGRRGTTPPDAPVPIRGDAPWLISDLPPVPSAPDAWGLWTWLPPGGARPAPARVRASSSIPQAVRQQLRALGYLR